MIIVYHRPFISSDIENMKRTPHRNPGFISTQVKSIVTPTRISVSVFRIIARITTPIVGSISDQTTHRSPTPEPVTIVIVMVIVIVAAVVVAATVMTSIVMTSTVMTSTVMTPTVTAAMAVRYGDRSALQNT
jgi:hypothetical protein